MIPNNRGQALVEFVLILPILLFLIFLIIDFGNIIYTKNHLENKTTDVIALVEEKKNFDEIMAFINRDSNGRIKLDLDYSDSGYLTIHIKEKVTVSTPGLNTILGNPYYVKTKRVIRYE